MTLTDQASALWAQTELASTLEWTTRGKRAMQGWAMYFYEILSRGAGDRVRLEWLEEQLTTGEYLVVGWIARYARGRDFRLSRDEVQRRFGPDYRATDAPDYGVPPSV